MPADTGSCYVENQYDQLARLTATTLVTPFDSSANVHSYNYDNGNQRTRQTFKAANYTDYTYDPIGQLKTAKGTEYDDVTSRFNEQFGYAYDKAGNLAFNVNNLNELTTETNKGTLTVAGTTTSPATDVTVNGANAILYSDSTFAKAGFTLTNGLNSFTALAHDTYGRSDSSTINTFLLLTNNFAYDLNGNLRTNGTRIFDYDDENQLIRITEPSAWKSEFAYDGLMRRRIRKEFTWSSGAWNLTNEVRYVYDGNLIVQERWLNLQLGTSNIQQLVTYTRGNDLSGSLEGAGGIGGLLARSSFSVLLSSLSSAFYHADGNGNITALVSTNGTVLARYQYDPFGDVLAMSGPLAEANLYRFSSTEVHPVSGLVYYLYRYYTPSLQRWISMDPLGDVGNLALMTANAAPWGSFENDSAEMTGDEFILASIQKNGNLYVGIANNPVNGIDAVGLQLSGCATLAAEPTLLMGEEALMAYRAAQAAKAAAAAAALATTLRGDRAEMGQGSAGRDHKTKSGPKQKERFQKKAKEKREQGAKDLQDAWDKWKGLSDEVKKLRPDLKPTKPDPSCK
jgi:RHS repeat-associated protein